MARLILGLHPHGAYGLFISKPGVAVENVSPNDTTNLIFSSNWGNIANIIASGTTQLNQTVTLPSVGFAPFVFIEEKVGSSYNFGTAVGLTQSVGVGQTRRYDYTRYIVQYLSDNQFQVRPKQGGIDAGVATQEFRYLAFNFAINQ